MTFHEMDALSEETGLPLSEIAEMTPRQRDDLLWGPDDNEEVGDADDFVGDASEADDDAPTWADIYNESHGSFATESDLDYGPTHERGLRGWDR